jgi:outer membrane biosynthesis protein TonB
MRTVNLDYFAKSVQALFFVGLVSGCCDRTEEVAKKDKDAEMVAGVTERDEIMAEPIAPTEPEPTIPAEPTTPVEPIEETLESILEKADEIIQKTEPPVSAMEEPPVSAMEEPPVSEMEEPEVVDDGLDVVKATPELVRNIQKALADKGFNPGAADGKLGPRTMGALNSFQRENGLAIGTINKETLRELGVSF